MKRIITLALLSMAVLSFAQEDFKRVALVVGNSNYQVAPLANPVNDATDVAALLTQQGFEVTKLLDSDRRTLVEGIRQFGEKLDN